MADYNAKIRTNYFSVTDPNRLKEILAKCQSQDTITIFNTPSSDGNIKYGFLCDGGIYGLPKETDIPLEDGEDYDDFEGDLDLLFKSLQELLPEGEAIIITEIGYEKFRYLVGCSTIITRNDVEVISLRDKALELAKKMLNNPDFSTRTEY